MTAQLIRRMLEQITAFGELYLTAAEATALDHELTRSPHAAVTIRTGATGTRLVVLRHVPVHVLPAL